MAKELIADPSTVAYWTMEVMGSDQNYTQPEWEALGKMKLDEPEDFMASFQSELDGLSL